MLQTPDLNYYEVIEINFLTKRKYGLEKLLGRAHHSNPFLDRREMSTDKLHLTSRTKMTAIIKPLEQNFTVWYYLVS